MSVILYTLNVIIMILGELDLWCMEVSTKIRSWRQLGKLQNCATHCSDSFFFILWEEVTLKC